MNRKKLTEYTPAEYYRIVRPEYFSDSELIYQTELPKEQLAFELSRISKNQKQDEFETLCRKISEKLIAPNLIPQVGPTGGGDGKTDFETYPVSKDISDRWFIPENGWKNDEKWAFAISSKEDWKNKAKSDIKNILSTKRDYTRIYFITNQTPSSKKKKEAQDQFIAEFNIDVIILDGVWLLESIYQTNLIELAVDSLNLSSVYKAKTMIVGENDARRSKKLIEIEEKIENPNRYFEYDFQLVEDALEAATLSRMLEKSRSEVEGKFDRAFRFCQKAGNNKQWLRLYYQRAWTYLKWYDDYSCFILDYKKFKSYLSENASISEIELFFNLINLLKVLSVSPNINLFEFDIDISKEKNDLVEILSLKGNDLSKPSSALASKTYKTLHELMEDLSSGNDFSEHLKVLSEYLIEGESHLDYPFDHFLELIELLGNILPANNDLDILIDTIAEIFEGRSSKIAVAEVYYKRANQKLSAKCYKESIVYFGKAMLKLAKEETKDRLHGILVGLSHAYGSLGLLWASNNCLVSAISISIRSWYESGTIDRKTYSIAKQLTINELYIGRIPSFLTWFELFIVLSKQVNIDTSKEEIPTLDLIDGCLSIRLLNTDYNKENIISLLPDLFEKHELILSRETLLYLFGYTDLVLENYEEQKINNYFKKLAEQPFVNQIVYKTNFLFGDTIELVSIILGCKFKLIIKEDKELLYASEMILAFFECFLATSMTNILPTTESITLNIVRNKEIDCLKYTNSDLSSEYDIEINSFEINHNELYKILFDLAVSVIAKNFLIDDIKTHLKVLFEKEELTERLTFVIEHRNMTLNILGNDPKLFLKDWVENKLFKEYPFKRLTPITFKNKNQKLVRESTNLEDLQHNARKVSSIIDNYLWDQAKWCGIGHFYQVGNFGIFLGFQNIEFGIKIFDSWIKKFGNEDLHGVIRLSIIKGVNKNKPYWYRVNIGSNLKNDLVDSGELMVVAARIFEIETDSPINLDKIISVTDSFQKLKLCAAKTSNEKIELQPNKYIIIKELIVKNAWEVGVNDPDSAAIWAHDEPIIPSNVINAPVIEVLKAKLDL